jgi:hypothetical protein
LSKHAKEVSVIAEEPVYISPSSVKSLWQEYLVYADRIELKTHVGTLVVPLSEIESVVVRESDVKGLLKGELQLRGFRPALKLDWANFVEHVVIDKNTGKVRRILFTPSDPNEFKEKLDELLRSLPKRS